jgi:NitT/TauT family transport system permease protein
MTGLTRFSRAALPAAFGLLMLVLWEATVRLNDVPEYIIPSPLAIAAALWTDRPELLRALAVTLQVTVAALVLAAITGAGIAFILAQWKTAERIFFPYAVFLQVTPIVTIAPFIIIWVENIFVVLLILAWMAAVFPIISNTLLGLKSADANLKDLFRLYGASRFQTATRLLAPGALPYFLGGLRISGGLALIGTVVAEMVAGTSGTQSGLASRLLEASYRLQLARAMACFVLLSLTGFALYVLLDWMSRRLLRHWHESARAADDQ